jgi:hypothetical protein
VAIDPMLKSIERIPVPQICSDGDGERPCGLRKSKRLEEEEVVRARASFRARAKDSV